MNSIATALTDTKKMEESDYTIKEFIEDNLKIKNKEGKLINLKFNHAQNELYDVIKQNFGKKPTRIIVLKARQLGISTFTEGLITALTINTPNTDAVLIAHNTESSGKIYEMTQLFIDCLPPGLRPKQKYSNKKQIVFDGETNGLKSSIRVMANGDATRGSTYRLAHVSEIAFFDNPKESMVALNQAIPSVNDSLAIIESTANGFNYFYEMWQDAVEGRSDYIPLFFPWYMDPSYSMPYRGFEKTQYEVDIQKKYNLTDDQLQWRRWCISNNCKNDEVMFRQEYPISPEEAFITSGQSVFNTEIIMNRMKEITPPIRKGYFTYDYDGMRITNIKWKDDNEGYIKIYQEPDGRNTVLGGDTAGEGEDFFVGQVLDSNGRQLAVLHHQFDEDLYTKQMYCLGRHYNSLIAIETNFSTYPNRELQRLGYRFLYVREKYDRIVSDVQPKFGFRTTSQTRPVIISGLVEIVRETPELINDRETLQEMLSFVYLKGKPQASEGAHDDLVLGLAIAFEALKQIPHKSLKTEISKPKRVVEKKNTYYEEFFNFGMEDFK